MDFGRADIWVKRHPCESPSRTRGNSLVMNLQGQDRRRRRRQSTFFNSIVWENASFLKKRDASIAFDLRFSLPIAYLHWEEEYFFDHYFFFALQKNLRSIFPVKNQDRSAKWKCTTFHFHVLFSVFTTLYLEVISILLGITPLTSQGFYSAYCT